MELIGDAVVLQLQVLVQLLLLGSSPLQLIVAPLDQVVLLEEDVVVALQHVKQLLAFDASQLLLVAGQSAAVGAELALQDVDLRGQFRILADDVLLSGIHLRELGTLLVELVLVHGDGLLVRPDQGAVGDQLRDLRLLFHLFGCERGLLWLHRQLIPQLRHQRDHALELLREVVRMIL